MFLSKESQLLTTFVIPFGRFAFKRISFGITSVPEIFQRKMSELLQDHAGVNVIMDDILIHGKGRKEHDERLAKVLETIKASGLRLNQEKCKLRATELTYFGHLVGQDGIKAHPEKTDAIMQLPPPANISELRTTLGMFNYLANFLPNLSTVL